jgi:hypothetical protein
VVLELGVLTSLGLEVNILDVNMDLVVLELQTVYYFMRWSISRTNVCLFALVYFPSPTKFYLVLYKVYHNSGCSVL